MTRRSLRTETMLSEFRTPIRIAGHVFANMPAVRVVVADGPDAGRGEAGGVFYTGDDATHMLAEIARVRDDVERGADRADLRALLPPGGARNALDAALWELEARQRGQPVWALAGIRRPRPLITTYTTSADEPAVLATKLADYRDARAVKVKLDGDLAADAVRLRMVRKALPGVWLMADANQGYDRAGLERLVPVLVETGVSLLEQPLPRGREAELDGLKLPMPLAADESVLGLDELPGLVGRFQVANLKLDKCGGLTEALLMVERARALGLGLMVGNMGGSSLAAAPAYLLAQLCDHVDLDGPLFLADDLPGGARYADGKVTIDNGFWGAAAPRA